MPNPPHRFLARQPRTALAIPLLLATLFPHAPAFAATDPFDPPLAKQVVQATANTPEITCIRYADLMVRELDTDGPGGGPSIIVPIQPGAPQPKCTAGAYAGSLAVADPHALLAGRKESYLIFDIYAAAGAEPFEVLDARTANVIYTDKRAPTSESFQKLEVEAQSLHLRFTRQIDARCSLLQSTTTCWQTLLRKKAIPPALAATPSATLCAASYKSRNATPDDPSAVLYDVEMILTAKKPTVLSRGAIQCEPAP